MISFISANGYLDGILRNHRSSLLTTGQYTNLCSCDTLDDLRVQLATTSYGDLLQADAAMTVQLFRDRLKERFVGEFGYLSENAHGLMAKFLEYITYGYMIDNVVLVLNGMQKSGSKEDLVRQCHPLGLFDSLPLLTTADDAQDTLLVLQDAPIGRYFKPFAEVHVEVLRAYAWREYLQDFDRFCRSQLDARSSHIMSWLLGEEADRRSLAIAVNVLNATGLPRAERSQLFPRMGELYAQGLTERLAQASDLASIRAIVDAHPLFSARFSRALDADADDGRSLEDCMTAEEVEQCKSTFEHPANYAVFYAWCRLKEQECRNVCWIAECIAQKQRGNVHAYIPIW